MAAVMVVAVSAKAAVMAAEAVVVAVSAMVAVLMAEAVVVAVSVMVAVLMELVCNAMLSIYTIPTTTLGLISTSVRVCEPCRGVVACSNRTLSC